MSNDNNNGPFAFINLDGDGPLPSNMPPGIQKLVKKIRDRDGTHEELLAITAQIQNYVTEMLGDSMAKQLDHMLQTASIYGANTGQMPCVLTVGRSGKKNEMSDDNEKDLVLDPKTQITSIGVVLTGQMNNDDVNLFTDYISQFIRDLTPAGGTVHEFLRENRLKRTPREEDPS